MTNKKSIRGPLSSNGEMVVRALNALAEVLAILFAARIATNFLVGAIVPDSLPVTIRDYAAEPDRYGVLNVYVLAATSALGQVIWFVLAFGAAVLVGWWRRRLPLRAYGLARGDHSLWQLTLIGLVLACFSLLPNQLFWVLNEHLHLGEGAAHFKYIDAMPHDLAFWLFLAASSFVLPPIFEEIVVRGYVLTRWCETFGRGIAIVILAFLFSFMHGQYLTGDLFGLLLSMSIVFGTAAWAYVTYRTRSLIPTIIAHLVANHPFKTSEWYSPEYLLAAMTIVVLVCIRPITRYCSDGLSLFRAPDFSGWRLVFGLTLVIIATLARPIFGPSTTVMVAAISGVIVVLTGLMLYRANTTRRR